MHATQREEQILEALKPSGFVTYRALEALLDASPATIRRDLARLEAEGQIERVHGGAKLLGEDRPDGSLRLAGTPFEQSITQHLAAKRAIGKAAAALCDPGEGVMIDGGTTTLQMCPHLAGLDLQVLTNSLHIVEALLPQTGTMGLGAIFHHLQAMAVGDVQDGRHVRRQAGVVHRHQRLGLVLRLRVAHGGRHAGPVARRRRRRAHLGRRRCSARGRRWPHRVHTLPWLWRHLG